MKPGHLATFVAAVRYKHLLGKPPGLGERPQYYYWDLLNWHQCFPEGERSLNPFMSVFHKLKSSAHTFISYMFLNSPLEAFRDRHRLYRRATTSAGKLDQYSYSLCVRPPKFQFSNNNCFIGVHVNTLIINWFYPLENLILLLRTEQRGWEHNRSVNTRALQELLTELSEVKEFLKSSLLLNQKLFEADNHQRAAFVVKSFFSAVNANYEL